MHQEGKDLGLRTRNFALQVIRFFPKLPRTTESQVLGRPLLRAATSVGANYREAFRGRSRAEFIAKCGDSLRGLEETGYWLELLVESKIVVPESISEIRSEWNELTAIFVAILKRSKESKN